MQLKRATTEDVDTYLALEKSVSESKLYSAFTEKEEALRELGNATVYFVVSDGKIVGHVAYEMKGEDHAYISGLVISPEYQGRGLAREALIKIFEELKNVKLIDLVTHPDNVKAIHLYESFGFKITDRYESYFGDDEPRVKLVLNKSIFSQVAELNLPIGQYAVIGGGVMAAHGIRECKDIDLLVTPDLYEELKRRGWKEKIIRPDFVVVENGVCEASPKIFPLPGYQPDTSRLIQEADIINGIPFIKLEEVVKFKEAFGRGKDLEDVRLINSYHDKRNDNSRN